MPIIKSTISKSLNRITRLLVNVPKKAHKYWVNITPKDTGNAKRQTTLVGDKIKTNYKYAVYLDGGSSKQAPRGMSKPTKEYVDNLNKHIFRK